MISEYYSVTDIVIFLNENKYIQLQTTNVMIADSLVPQGALAWAGLTIIEFCYDWPGWS